MVAVTANRGRAARPSANSIDLTDVVLASVILVRGAEGALGERVISHLRGLARKVDQSVEETDVSSATYQPGQLEMWSSPSLFEERRFIVIEGLEVAGDGLVQDVLRYLGDPADEVVLVLRHKGGVKNKKVMDQIKAGGFPTYLCEEIKQDAGKLQLIGSEARGAGGRFTADAAQSLVDASGNDLYGLLGAVRQLVADNDGDVTGPIVHQYFAGREEATGFEVADAVAAGDGPRALLLARRAFSSDVNPVPLVAVLAMKLRAIAKVLVPGIAANDLGMSPWQATKARQEAGLWTMESVGAAICIVARADADVKGGSRDANGAVEKCIIEISRVRSRQSPAR